MLNADFMRLRAPVPDDVHEMLKHRPLLLKGAQLAQPALQPGHKLPLKVSFWPDTPLYVIEAAKRATDEWAWAMNRHTPYKDRPILLVDITTPHLDLVVGVKPFEIPFDPVAEFGNVAVGYFGQHTFGQPFGTPNGELGNIELFWDEQYRTYYGGYAGRVFVPDDITNLRVLEGILGHEFGHGLLAGHSPHTPSHIMYRHHTDVTAPKKPECKVVWEIWT